MSCPCEPTTDARESRPGIEIADILREHYHHLQGLSPQQWEVVRAVVRCRTAALGGHLWQCDRCGHDQISYNSCRNRHCPACQSSARTAWLEARMAELLPVPYFHVVFTIPDLLAPLALQNKRLFYDLLFRSASESLSQAAANPKNLGARIGFLAVLHTWGQNLHHHPHIHCVVPAGGLSADSSRWISTGGRFFLPVKVLSRLLRGKMLDYLKRAYRSGKLCFHGKLEPLAGDPDIFAALINTAYAKDWVVYAKPPFAGPAQVLRYLGRYTHRVAISNHRILAFDDGAVSFRWKDYKHAGRWRTMNLEGREFIRRFLLHVLPKGYVRIRSYGILSNRCKAQSLSICRRLLGQTTNPPDRLDDTDDAIANPPDYFVCPKCRRGHMVAVRVIEPQPPRAGPPKESP
jgi:hypothetical protein